MLTGIQNILEFQLFSIKNYTLTVYDVAIIALILVVARLLVWSFKKFLRRSFLKRQIDDSRQVAVSKLAKYFIYVIAVVVGLETVGVDVSLIIAGSAAFLVGLGFGVQQIFGDLVSGLIILFEGTIGVGDVVELDDGTIGRVQETGLRTSRITTRDNIDVIIPNSKFIQDNVVNWSHNRTLTRFDVEVGVAYGSDVQLVKKSLSECAEKHPQVVDNPSPFARFDEFGESSLDFTLLFWTSDDFGVETIKSDLRFSIDQIFRDNGITIPFPQRDLHFKTSQVSFKE